MFKNNIFCCKICVKLSSKTPFTYVEIRKRIKQKKYFKVKLVDKIFLH